MNGRALFSHLEPAWAQDIHHKNDRPINHHQNHDYDHHFVDSNGSFPDYRYQRSSLSPSSSSSSSLTGLRQDPDAIEYEWDASGKQRRELHPYMRECRDTSSSSSSSSLLPSLTKEVFKKSLSVNRSHSDWKLPYSSAPGPLVVDAPPVPIGRDLPDLSRLQNKSSVLTLGADGKNRAPVLSIDGSGLYDHNENNPQSQPSSACFDNGLLPICSAGTNTGDRQPHACLQCVPASGIVHDPTLSIRYHPQDPCPIQQHQQHQFQQLRDNGRMENAVTTRDRSSGAGIVATDVTLSDALKTLVDTNRALVEALTSNGTEINKKKRSRKKSITRKRPNPPRYHSDELITDTSNGSVDDTGHSDVQSNGRSDQDCYPQSPLPLVSNTVNDRRNPRTPGNHGLTLGRTAEQHRVHAAYATPYQQQPQTDQPTVIVTTAVEPTPLDRIGAACGNKLRPVWCVIGILSLIVVAALIAFGAWVVVSINRNARVNESIECAIKSTLKPRPALTTGIITS